MEKGVTIVVDIVIMLTAFLSGWFLAWLCKEEVIPDRKWFYIAFYCLVAAFVAFFIFYINQAVILTIAYMIITFGVMISLGYKKRFMRSK